MKLRRAVVAAASLVCGCADVGPFAADYPANIEPPDFVDLTVTAGDVLGVLPIGMRPADCAVPTADFEDKLEATLRMGGHRECPLTVNKTDRTVSGTCEYVTVGIVRPVALVWYLEPPTGMSRVQLQYHVSFVNLVKDSLTAETTSVAIDFVDDGTNGTIWYHPDELTEIPATEPSDRDGLETAMYWAGGTMTDAGYNDVQPLLDRDGDGCPNLVEACDGVLYDDIDIWTGSPGANSTCSLPDPPQ